MTDTHAAFAMTPRLRGLICAAAVLPFLSAPLPGQSPAMRGAAGEAAAEAMPLAANGIAIRDEMLGHFQRSSFKMTSLSEAMPVDLYTWAPGEGVMSVATVYAHIARYNFMYLSDNLGIPAPAGIDWQNLESLTEKAAIVEALRASIEHVEARVGEMTEAELNATTTLYGREVPSWAVLVQLVSHMNEHVGQSVAYARVNGIVPPWSR